MQKEELHQNIAASIRSGIDPKTAVAAAYAQKRKAERSATPAVEASPVDDGLSADLPETAPADSESAPAAVTSSSLTDDMRAAILRKKQNRKFE